MGSCNIALECRFQRNALELSDDPDADGNFRVPKNQDTHKFEETIPKLGSAAITSAALGEAAHKAVVKGSQIHQWPCRFTIGSGEQQGKQHGHERHAACTQ